MAIKSWSSSISGGYRCGTANWTTKSDLNQVHNLEVSVSTNPGGNNSFVSDHVTRTGSLLNNDGPVPAMNPGFDRCPSNFYGFQTPHMSVPNVSSVDFTRLEAHTNPSNPNILLPVFFWELKDVPDMIRQGGRIADAIRRGKPWRRLIRPDKATQDAAAANLAIQFGWAPFISDLRRLATFQDAVDKRRKMFEKLETKGLRGRVDLDSWSSRSGRSWTAWSTCGWVHSVPVEIEQSVTRWASIRWKVNDPSRLPRSDGELRRRLTGLTFDSVPIAVWEAMPWSWLVDYFFNVGNLLKAGNRTIASPSHACVMTKYETKATHRGRRIDLYRVISDGEYRSWRHTRSPQPGPSSASAALPKLSASQLSILGSLAVLRARPGRRT